MKELDKAKAALEIAVGSLRYMRDMVGGSRKEFIADALEKVTAILNPAPIMEDVEEIVGWVNVYQKADGSHLLGSLHAKQEDATNAQGAVPISCQPIKVTVKREKKAPVERSVTVECTVLKGNRVAGDAVGVDHPNPFFNFPEFHGCKGYLTFTTTEEPHAVP